MVFVGNGTQRFIIWLGPTESEETIYPKIIPNEVAPVTRFLLGVEEEPDEAVTDNTYDFTIVRGEDPSTGGEMRLLAPPVTGFPDRIVDVVGVSEHWERIDKIVFWLPPNGISGDEVAMLSRRDTLILRKLDNLDRETDDWAELRISEISRVADLVTITLDPFPVDRSSGSYTSPPDHTSYRFTIRRFNESNAGETSRTGFEAQRVYLKAQAVFIDGEQSEQATYDYNYIYSDNRIELAPRLMISE